MRPDNPACYECPKDKRHMHTWKLRDNGTAYCLQCNTSLTKEETMDCFTDMEQYHRR